MSVAHSTAPWWTTESGVRNSGGYVHLKMHATRYEGQDERYAKEVAEREANECLIAAAPELLAALLALRPYLQAGEALIADAAISKATGSTS